MSKSNNVVPSKAQKFFQDLERCVYGKAKTYDFNVYSPPQPDNVGWDAVSYPSNDRLEKDLKQAVEDVGDINIEKQVEHELIDLLVEEVE